MTPGLRLCASIACLLASLAFYYFQNTLGSASITLIAMITLQFACLWSIARALISGDRHVTVGSSTLKLVWTAALVARLAIAPSEPWLANDHYRYMWDGKVILSGINPYSLPPNSSALDPLRTDYREKINFPDLRTIYPPVSQIVFALAAALNVDS